MKRNIISCILFGTLLLSATAVSAAKYSFDTTTEFNIDETETYIKGEHTMIPLRKVAENLGFTVEWNDDEQSVSINNDKIETKIFIGKDCYYVTTKDGKGIETPVEVGVAPEIKNDKSYVPAVMFNILNHYDDLSNYDKDGSRQHLSSKVLVNIEGRIKSLNDNKITLETGKVVIITDKTVFEGDPDMGKQEVSRELKVGNYICGYTKDDLNNQEIVADRIYRNNIDRY